MFREIMCLAAAFSISASTMYSQIDTTRIMLMGDSITEGYDGSDPVGGFRDNLDSMLTDTGAWYDLVGTLHDGVGFDADHEGHGGWTVDMMLADVDSFLQQTDPGIVLIHLGTNDISADQGVSSTLVEMDSLLSHIYNYNPSMIVHLSGIIPRNDSKDSLATELNAGYLGIVNDWSALGYSIKYVDHNSAFKADPTWQNDYMFDHVHPDNAGYALMAQTYFDSLATEDIFDNIAPSAVSDVAVSGVNSRTVLLTWTATGDNDTTGTASWYDVRYSTSPITESNFGSATQAVGEPDPLPAGSSEEFTVGGLDPAVTYYFALKAVDESDNVSPLSNVPFATTVGVPTLVDDFERAVLGPDWSADPEFAISNGELANESLEDRWDFMSVYVPVTGVEDVKLRWGVDADSAGIGEGGFALMLDSPSPDANGYLIFRHRTYNYYALWTIVNGVPDSAVMQSPVSTLPYPQAGDTFEVVVSSDVHGHHFDCYINGVYDTRVSDPGKAQGNGSQLWYGVMLHGNRNNNVADFWLSGATANVPPGEFGLLSPADGSTVETGVPLLDWEDSVDPNLSDSVLYTLYYGTSAVFAPESTTVVSGLSGSDYTIPPMGILSLVRKSAGSVSDALVRSGVSGGLVPGGSAVRVPVSREAVVSPVGPEPSSLPDDVVIYWKVKAVDTGSLETWSLQQDWSFVVSIPDPPLPFDLLSPADGDTVETLTPTLSWQATTDPDPGDTVTYTLYYGTDPGLGSGTVIVSGLAEPAFTTPALDDNTLYYWKVEAVDSRDLITESNQEFSFYVRSPSGIGGGVGQLPPALPKAFALGQNYPNPFNPSTSIRFDIPAGASSEAGVHVLIQVYSLRGRLIRTLENGVRAPGSYVVHWDGRDDRGEKAGSGIYLYTIHAADFTATKKMVILK